MPRNIGSPIPINSHLGTVWGTNSRSLTQMPLTQQWFEVEEFEVYFTPDPATYDGMDFLEVDDDVPSGMGKFWRLDHDNTHKEDTLQLPEVRIYFVSMEKWMAGKMPCRKIAAWFNPNSGRWESEYVPEGMWIGRVTETIPGRIDDEPGIGEVNIYCLNTGDELTPVTWPPENEEDPPLPVEVSVFNPFNERICEGYYPIHQDGCCHWWIIPPGDTLYGFILSEDMGETVSFAANAAIQDVITLDPIGTALVYDQANIWPGAVSGDQGLAIKHCNRYIIVALKPTSTSGDTLYAFYLTEDMGATTFAQATAEILDINTLAGIESSIVHDPLNIWPDALDQEFGLAIKHGTKYYVVELREQDNRVKWAVAYQNWSHGAGGDCDYVLANPCDDCEGTNPDTGTTLTILLPRVADRDPNVNDGEVIAYEEAFDGSLICTTDYLDSKIKTVTQWAGGVGDIAPGWGIMDGVGNATGLGGSGINMGGSYPKASVVAGTIGGTSTHFHTLNVTVDPHLAASMVHNHNISLDIDDHDPHTVADLDHSHGLWDVSPKQEVYPVGGGIPGTTEPIVAANPTCTAHGPKDGSADMNVAEDCPADDWGPLTHSAHSYVLEEDDAGPSELTHSAYGTTSIENHEPPFMTLIFIERIDNSN